MCACELVVHFGWGSACPPCQPPPARGRPASGSLLAGATYRKAEGCSIPGAMCNLISTFFVWHSGLRSGEPRAGPAAGRPGVGCDNTTQDTTYSRTRPLFRIVCVVFVPRVWRWQLHFSICARGSGLWVDWASETCFRVHITPGRGYNLNRLACSKHH